MRYLITTNNGNPFVTEYYSKEMHADKMVCYDLQKLKFTTNGIDWLDIEEDHL